MRCPMCESAVLQASHRHGIEVDVCPRCKGIWLDRGELEKILDALDAQLDEVGAARPSAPAASPLPPPPPAPHQQQPAHDDRYDDDRRRDDRGWQDRPWSSPELLHGRAWATKSPPPGYRKPKKGKKHRSALAHLLDEVL